MLSKAQHHLLTALGLVALLLVIANAWLFMHNRATQLQLAQRQQFVQQTAPLDTLYREIVKALAESALKSNDRPVLEMLAAQGVDVTPNAPAPVAEPVASAPFVKGKR